MSSFSYLSTAIGFDVSAVWRIREFPCLPACFSNVLSGIVCRVEKRSILQIKAEHNLEEFSNSRLAGCRRARLLRILRIV